MNGKAPLAAEPTSGLGRDWMQALNRLSDGLVVIQDGRFAYANAAAASLLGVERPELLLGRRVLPLLPASVRAAALALWRATAPPGRNSPALLPIVGLDGVARQLPVTATPITFAGRPAMLLAGQPAGAADLLATALSQAADAIVLSDLDGTILYANQAFGALTGWSPSEAVGRNLAIIQDPPPADGEPARVRDSLRRGQAHHWRGPVRHRDGSTRVEDGRLSPVSLDGRQVTHALLVRRDITHEAARERMLGEQGKMQAVGRLAGGVAHELNNLLTTIGGFSQFLLDSLGTQDPRRHDAIEIRRAADRATDLVAQLLAVGRRQLVTPRRTDLNDLLRALAPSLAAAAGNACPVHLDLAPTLSPVEIDPKQIEHALLALVHNAREASPDGGPLTIRTTEMTIGEGELATWYGLKAGRYLNVSVEDHGAGMSEEVRATAFEPFFTTKAGPHSGLGLSAVYGVVQQNGGQLECRSVPGQGTTMTVILPCSLGSARRSAQATTTTVLVVDDEPSVRNIVARSLRQAGYLTLTAEGPTAAQALAADRDEPIDLLITDVVMPGLRGDALALALSAHWPELGIIYISGYPETELAESALHGARRAYLPKPFSPQTLLDTVRRVMGEPSRAGQTGDA